MKLRTKQEMYEAYYRKRFGNMLSKWATLDDYFDSGYLGPVTLRYSGAGGGSWCQYGVERAEVPVVVDKWVKEGANPGLIQINEAAPDSALTIQGEVYRSEAFLSMRYSTLKKPMRVALAEKQQHVEGLAALLTLQTYIDPASFDDLMSLLDDFEGAVVEFSCYSQDIGECPRRNTVFWEVRHY